MTSTNDAGPRTDFAGIQALLSREPGYSVALKCLQVQAAAEAIAPTLRSKDRVTLHPDAWSWYTGAIGEIEVGKILSQLGSGWFVRHSVPIGAGTKDVDHLLIGPSGVFAINTKHHRDAVIWVGDHVLRVNNGNTHHLKAARAEAIEVARRLAAKVDFPVTVTSVIVTVGEHSITDRRSANNRPTAVVGSRQLLRWLNGKARVSSDGALGLIRLAAEEPDTWHVDPRAADTLRVMQRFDRLRAAVGPNPVAPVRSAPKTSPSPRRRPQARAGTKSRGVAVRLAGGLLSIGLTIAASLLALQFLGAYFASLGK